VNQVKSVFLATSVADSQCVPGEERKRYEVATISRLLKITGLFCRIQSLLYGSFAKETYNFKEPTNRSHPIVSVSLAISVWDSQCVVGEQFQCVPAKSTADNQCG